MKQKNKLMATMGNNLSKLQKLDCLYRKLRMGACSIAAIEEIVNLFHSVWLGQGIIRQRYQLSEGDQTWGLKVGQKRSFQRCEGICCKLLVKHPPLFSRKTSTIQVVR